MCQFKKCPFHISAGTPTILKGFVPFLSLSMQILRKCAGISQYRLRLQKSFHHSMCCPYNIMGPDISVGIPNRYGLGTTGIESRWERGFPRPSRLSLGPTRPPVYWVPGLLPGVKRLGRSVDHLHPLSAEVKKIGGLNYTTPLDFYGPL